MSLKCAIPLGILDIMFNHGKPMTLPELINSLPINNSKAPCIHHLMCILVHSGYLAETMITENGDEKKGYNLTSSNLLLKSEPFSLAPFLLSMIDPVMVKPWHHLSEWCQNDDPTPFKTAHGRTFWDYGGHDPRHNDLFNQATASDARFVSSVVVKDCKQVFEGLKSIVDVGDGTGMLAGAIAEVFPHLKCTVLDLPQVVGGLEGTKNLNYVAGDMFEFIPRAEAVLLKVKNGD